MQDRVVRQEPAHSVPTFSEQLHIQVAACAKTSSVRVQIRFYPLDELHTGRCEKGERPCLHVC